MEELKLLVEMVASLPQAAIWVLVLFFCYKTIIIGSIYGVIRMGMTLLHSWATKPKQVEYTLRNKVITESLKARFDLAFAKLLDSGDYLSYRHIDKFEQALDLTQSYSGVQIKEIKTDYKNKHKLTTKM